MKKLCINNRDVLLIINLDDIAYVIADGNYVKLTYITGVKRLLSIGISDFYGLIVNIYNESSICPFIKLGRSVVINQLYLSEINILKHSLMLSDNKIVFTIQMPKQLLKSYREMIRQAQTYK